MSNNGYENITDKAIMGMYFDILSQLTGAGWLSRITNLFKSSMQSEDYAWLGMVPGFTEFKGSRKIEDLPEYKLSIRNVEYDTNLRFKKKDMRRDKTGQIEIRIREHAERSFNHWAKLVSSLINNGHDATHGLAYDGQFFFDTDHTVGDSGTMSNDITVDISTLPASVSGTVANPSTGEMELAIFKTIQQMLSFKDDTGEPLNESSTGFDIMVPLPYWGPALSALKNQVIDSNNDNTLVTAQIHDGLQINLSVNNRLTETDTFFGFVSDKAVKPFIRQEELEIEAEVLGEGSDHAYKNREHLYGLFASRAAGLGRFERACRTQLI